MYTKNRFLIPLAFLLASLLLLASCTAETPPAVTTDPVAETTASPTVSLEETTESTPPQESESIFVPLPPEVVVDPDQNRVIKSEYRFPYYVIFVTDDHYGLLMDARAYQIQSENYLVVKTYVTFNSMWEFYDSVMLTGIEKAEHLKLMTRFPSEIYNLNALYVPYLSDVPLTAAPITWEGDFYDVAFTAEQFKGFYRFFTTESFRKSHDSYRRSLYESPFMLSVEETADRDAEVIMTETEKYVCYTLTHGERTLSVYETYVLSYSETVPTSVDVYVSEKDVCYQVTLSRMTKRPTVEALLRLQAVPYDYVKEP